MLICEIIWSTITISGIRLPPSESGRKKGIEVSSRGRIAAEVLEQYKHANQ
ncbi:Lsr2 family DNA-binding protein [Nocardia gipuzkoensis]